MSISINFVVVSGGRMRLFLAAHMIPLAIAIFFQKRDIIFLHCLFFSKKIRNKIME